MTIKVVNNWEIEFNEKSIAPYQIRYGRKYDQVYCWKTLAGAVKWAEKN